MSIVVNTADELNDLLDQKADLNHEHSCYTEQGDLQQLRDEIELLRNKVDRLLYIKEQDNG